MEFQKFIKAVATGPKGNRDLSFEESLEMMNQILLRKVPNELISAFLVGWRLKPETITEYRGALSALDALVKSKTKTIENSIELGYPFDGKANRPFMLPLIANELKRTGLNLIVIGDDLQPGKNGITIKQLKQNVKLGENIFYFDRSDYLLELHHLTEIRMMLGVRSAFNTIEKLPNLGNSKYAITGVFHKPYVQKYNEIFEGRYERFALLQANEGAPELFNKAKLWVSAEGTLQEILIDPEYYGIEKTENLENITIQNTIDLINDPNQNMIKLAKLNAAMLMFVAGKSNSIEVGYESLN